MEGEKEREREHKEEKESDEAEDRKSDDDDATAEEEDEAADVEGAAMAWQEAHCEDDLGLPIMHWEALSLHIAELEKQEQLRKQKRTKTFSSLERGRAPVCWREDRERESPGIWEDREEDSHMTALTSRLQTQVNLQLCFINNSESEEEEEREKESNKKRALVQVPRQTTPPVPSMPQKSRPSRGFRNALRSLRDKLRTDQKQKYPVRHDALFKARHFERSDLQPLDAKELNAFCISLTQAIQDLSAELVALLQARDQLRTEQDAMLLEVQDLTSL